ncbi:uncharacterized protein N7477_003560 [Penicillium maclennaniae]|uniref:uncharacterized protein n=1 Tax=Penicillium maclennaniae TaxID=1343394 RepID=UPI002540CBF9|nr:uncharacterized protein N7477_003560 [Penicillium maclennaniae]KAJ5677927.1 hypothetical protein N7477_003560 [Penicillium maclennaniae]
MFENRDGYGLKRIKITATVTSFKNWIWPAYKSEVKKLSTKFLGAVAGIDATFDRIFACTLFDTDALVFAAGGGGGLFDFLGAQPYVCAQRSAALWGASAPRSGAIHALSTAPVALRGVVGFGEGLGIEWFPVTVVYVEVEQLVLGDGWWWSGERQAHDGGHEGLFRAVQEVADLVWVLEALIRWIMLVIVCRETISIHPRFDIEHMIIVWRLRILVQQVVERLHCDWQSWMWVGSFAEVSWRLNLWGCALLTKVNIEAKHPEIDVYITDERLRRENAVYGHGTRTEVNHGGDKHLHPHELEVSLGRHLGYAVGEETELDGWIELDNDDRFHQHQLQRIDGQAGRKPRIAAKDVWVEEREIGDCGRSRERQRGIVSEAADDGGDLCKLELDERTDKIGEQADRFERREVAYADHSVLPACLENVWIDGDRNTANIHRISVLEHSCHDHWREIRQGDITGQVDSEREPE